MGHEYTSSMPNMVNHPRKGLATCYAAVMVAVSTIAEALLINLQVWRLFLQQR